MSDLTDIPALLTGLQVAPPTGDRMNVLVVPRDSGHQELILKALVGSVPQGQEIAFGDDLFVAVNVPAFYERRLHATLATERPLRWALQRVAGPIEWFPSQVDSVRE